MGPLSFSFLQKTKERWWRPKWRMLARLQGKGCGLLAWLAQGCWVLGSAGLAGAGLRGKAAAASSWFVVT